MTSWRSHDQNPRFSAADDAAAQSVVFVFIQINTFTYLRKMSIYQMNSIMLNFIYVMEWWSHVEGQDTGSGVRKNGDHSRRTAAIGFYLLSSRQFSAHTRSSRACIDKRTARAARNTHYRCNKIGPLDHKMGDNCVSLARTNTLSSTITKLIKT